MGCVNGPAINCDDGIGCTFDVCNESGGGSCLHYAQDYLCDDNKFCNGSETCTMTGCKAGIPPVCNDNVACTSDICDPVLDACKGIPNNSLCPCGQTCSPSQG